MRVVTFKIDEYTLEKLDDLANVKGVTRSDLIRRALELYIKLEEYNEQPRPKYVRLLS